jgi:UDP-N-acetylmuramoyl-L-alanyl-D-glutamate--2,6-diaminopimelate ligase
MNECIVKELTMDSRRVKPGDLFIAVQGSTKDGRDYIEDAIQNGAVAVLVELGTKFILKKDLSRAVPIVTIPNLKVVAGHIAARFFTEPSKRIPIIGITGTNGKTSIAHFIAQILNACEKPCGFIGTLGVGFLENLKNLSCTTPDPVVVQRTLADLNQKGTTTVVMEVTSHALEQSRVEGVHFHTAIFSNLTQDHLDYHKTIQNYWATKRKLFTDFQPKFSIINLEDEQGKALVLEGCLQKNNQKVFGFTTCLEGSNHLREVLDGIITAHDLMFDDSGISAFIQTPWGEGQLCCPLFGRFNLSNLLAAVTAVCLQGVSLAQVLKHLPLMKTVPGRMTCLGGKEKSPLVIIDYAHTPDALMQVLTSLRIHCRHKLWCVFGCGGDRDRSKRPLMASVVEDLSDYFIMTQDNSRTENPKQIFEDMLQGLKHPEQAVIEMNRKKAIRTAIQAAGMGDIVVIAGKGHEDYQVIGTEKKAFSDHVEAQQALVEKMTWVC